MTGSKLALPFYGLDTPDSEDGDTERQQESKVTSKDWCRPTAVSMAKLKQIQANVYNMGFAKNLKPPRSIRKQGQQPRSAWGTGQKQNESSNSHTSSHNGNNEHPPSFRELEPNPPLTATSYQRSAWGSNSSIPDLIAKHGKRNLNRPASAKTQVRPRPSSASKPRPQSAKEPLNQSQDPQEQNISLGVTGHKKGMSNKPTPRGPLPNNLGYISGVGSENGHRKSARASAGPLIGHTMEQEHEGGIDLLEFEELVKKMKAPQVPFSSPVNSDVEDEEREAVTKPSVLLRRPVPEPIHLSLPNADERNDDDTDELNTERLLQQADEYVLKKAEEEQQATDNLAIARATLPTPEDEELVSWSRESSPDPFFQLGKESHKSNTSSSFANGSGKSSSTLTQSATNSFSVKGGTHECWATSGPQAGVTEERTHGRMYKGSKQNKPSANFILPDDGDNSYQPLEVSKTQSRPKSGPQVRSNVKICEDRNITVSITPRNIGRKPTTKSTGATSEQVNHRSGYKDSCGDDKGCFCEAGLSGIGLTSKASACPKCEIKRIVESHDDTDSEKGTAKNGRLATMVTLNYENQDDGNKMKKRKLKKGSQANDVDTLIGSLSDVSCELNVSATLHKSKGEKNYYEIARNHTYPHFVSEGSNLTQSEDEDMEKSSVFKTTKTIEFAADAPQEVVSKSAIGSLHKGKDENNTSQKYHSSAARPLMPSTIKRQQERSRAKKQLAEDSELSESVITTEDSSQVSTVNDEMLAKSLDKLSTMLDEAKNMACASMTNASKDRPPSGKRPTLTSQRPKSAMKKSSSTPQLKPQQKAKTSVNSMQIKQPSMADISRSKQAIEALRKDEGAKRYSMYSAKPKPAPTITTRRIKSASSAGRPPPGLISVGYMEEIFTPELQECQEMQDKMAALGVEVNLRALERALYPPSGKPIHYEVEGQLPSDPCFGLLPHYKHWLPEDYKRIKMMERRLAEDDRIKYMQKLREEKKLKNAGKKKAGKKKSCTLQVRRNSVV